MVADGEDELICDFAQYYHILDWRGLPLLLAATLASGLPAESRCMLRQSGARAGTDTVLLATLVDQTALLLWRYAKKNTPKPQSVADLLLGEQEKKPPIRVYRSGADFDRALQRFIK